MSKMLNDRLLKGFFYVMFLFLIFLAGYFFGLAMGTYAVIDHVAKGFSGSTITIDLNETNLINEMNKTIYPQMKIIMEERLK